MCVHLFLSWDRLTAFVLRSFAQAKTYIPKTVDMDILNSAVEFLFTRQNPRERPLLLSRAGSSMTRCR